MVIPNRAQPESEELARQYCRDRAVLEEHPILLQYTTSETIPEDDYLTDIQSPVRHALRERKLVEMVDFLLVVKGVPIKTARREAPTSTQVFNLQMEGEPTDELSPPTSRQAWRSGYSSASRLLCCPKYSFLFGLFGCRRALLLSRSDHMLHQVVHLLRHLGRDRLTGQALHQTQHLIRQLGHHTAVPAER